MSVLELDGWMRRATSLPSEHAGSGASSSLGARSKRGARSKLVMFSALAVLAAPTVSHAADESLGFRLPLEFRSWSLESTGTAGGGNGGAEGGETSKETVEQFYLPLVSTLWIGPQTSLVASTAGATSSFENAASVSSSLDGASDVELQLYHRLSGPRLLLFAGGRLPSGKKELTREELAVADILSHPVLGMRLRELGRGFEINGGLAWSVPLGGKSATLGAKELVLAAGARLPGSYDLAAELDSYKPSAEASASIGLRWKNAAWQRSLRSASLQVAYRLYGDDEVGAVRIFREGNQLELKGRAELPAGSLRIGLRTVAVIKEQNTAYGMTGDDIGSLKLDSGTGIWGGVSLRHPVGDRVQVGGDFDVRTFDGNESADRDGTAFEVGPALGVTFAEGYRAQLSARYLVGTLGQDASERDLSGFAVGASLTLRPF